MLLLLSLALMASATEAVPPTIRLAAVAGEGMSQDEIAAIESRIGEELGLMGAQLARGEPPAEGCLADASCRRGLAAGAAGVLTLKLVRVGPILQVKAQLFGPDGTERKAVARDVQIDGVSAAASLLGPEMAAEIRALLSPVAPAPAEAPSPPADANADGGGGGGGVLPWVLAGSGLGVLGLGAAAGVAGIAVALWQTLTAYTPSTPGDAKGTALILAPVGAAAAAAGVAVIAVGGAVALGGLLVE